MFGCAKAQELQLGAARMGEYLPLLEGKRVALVVNQTSVINNTHLVDTLVSRGVNVVKVMAPEHGFRGEVPDGEVTVSKRVGTVRRLGDDIFVVYRNPSNVIGDWPGEAWPTVRPVDCQQILRNQFDSAPGPSGFDFTR